MKLKISGRAFELPEPGNQWTLKERPGGWWIAERKHPNGQVDRQRILANKVGEKLWFHLGGRSYSSEYQAPHSSGGIDTNKHADSDFTAQFPGKVRKVLVKSGQLVKQGENLVLIEAMKMEFTIRAPSNGCVDGILVTDGQQLMPGTQLLKFSAEEHG